MATKAKRRSEKSTTAGLSGAARQRKKLLIQIPCYNEEATLPVVLATLPRHVAGFDSVEWLIIDDGSTDRTAQVARELGVDHIVRHRKNRGLARAFVSGLNACLRAGADVIVNTDADNQYDSRDIPGIVGPILAEEADMVIGRRPVSEIAHFSPFKKFLQRVGSWFVKAISRTDAEDAPSGFRAFSRRTAQELNVFGEYTYTIETIMQAGKNGMRIVSVPIRVNPDLRPSRLVKSNLSYVRRSLVTIVRILVIYKPWPFFVWPGLVLACAGFLLYLRYLYFFFEGSGVGHMQSVLVASVMILAGFGFMGMGGLAEIISINRRLLESIQTQLREIEDRTVQSLPGGAVRAGRAGKRR